MLCVKLTFSAFGIASYGINYCNLPLFSDSVVWPYKSMYTV